MYKKAQHEALAYERITLNTGCLLERTEAGDYVAYRVTGGARGVCFTLDAPSTPQYESERDPAYLQWLVDCDKTERKAYAMFDQFVTRTLHAVYDDKIPPLY